MNNAVFEKAMQKVTKFGDMKLVTTKRRRNYLASEPNYHTTKFFTEHLLAYKSKKIEMLMNKPVCLGLSVLEFRKTLIYDSWYDYAKPKYRKKHNYYL